MIRTVVAFLGAASLLGCDDGPVPPLGSGPPASRGVIRGTVVEPGTLPLRSLVDARITVMPGDRVTGTDPDGRYEVDELPIPQDGLDYSVRASKPGFNTVTAKTTLSPTRPEATVNFQLRRQTSIVSGTTR